MIRLFLMALALLIPALAFAEGPVVDKATCTVSWDAPTTNADGTPLADLAGYDVYLGDSPADVAASGPLAQVLAPSPSPVAGATVTWPCSGLAARQHYLQLAAYDLVGNRSARTPVFPFVVQITVPPPTDPAPSAPTRVRIP